MAVMRTTILPLALAVLLLVAACTPRASGEAGTPAPGTTEGASTEFTLPAGGLVLQVVHTDGFLTPQLLAARPPLVSVYADGRVITQGPQIEIFPPPALPNLQVQHVDAEAVSLLVDRALRAGVAGSADLGRPPVADLPTTRFTVVTREETSVREVYALGAEGPPDPPGSARPDSPGSGLTEEQQAARTELQDLLRALVDPASALPAETVGEQEQYLPAAVAGIVTEWADPQTGLDQEPVPWPGPRLPGSPLEPRLGLSCVLADGEQAQEVLAAARSAGTATPWLSEDGRRWSVALRPLMPHEKDCADLAQW
jgi:hypothetical protein